MLWLLCAVACVVEAKEEPQPQSHLSLFVMVENHNDHLKFDLVSTQRPYGQVILRTLFGETSTDPNDYDISDVTKDLSGELPVQSYQYVISVSRGMLSQETMVNCLEKPGMLGKINQMLGFKLLRISGEKSVASKITLYAMVDIHNDYLGKETYTNDKRYGGAMLTTVFDEFIKKPDDYHIHHVQKFFNDDNSVRTYQYDFFDLTGNITEENLVKCLIKPDILRDVNVNLGFSLLRLSNTKWRGTLQTLYVMTDNHNDFLDGEKSLNNNPDDCDSNKLYGKAILTTLLSQISDHPEDYYIRHVTKYFDIDNVVRTYQYDFFDLTGETTQDIIIRYVKQEGMLQQINKALGFSLLKVSHQKENPTKHTVYFIVRKHFDTNTDTESPNYETDNCTMDRNVGKALLAKLCYLTSPNTDDYYVMRMEKDFSRDKTMRQYRYDFVILLGSVSPETLTWYLGMDDIWRRMRDAANFEFYCATTKLTPRT